jgi:cupin fold WbuC family metalloprotein
MTSEVSVADGPVVCVSQHDIEFLKERVRNAPRGRVRLCAHAGPESPVHEMLLVLSGKSYVRPHRHPGKSESFHIVEGVLDVVLFDDGGILREVVSLGDRDSGRPFYYRLNEPLFHMPILRSDLVVFHETTTGPFRQGEAVWAPWAPAEGSGAVGPFLQDLEEKVMNFVAVRRDGSRPSCQGTHSLIVGGTRGIGSELARLLAAQGHVVSVLGRHAPAEPDQLLAHVSHWMVDLLDEAALATTLDDIVARRGRLNNLVFLQRFQGDGDRWLGEFATSLTATRFVIERLADRFSPSADNSIVVVTSIADQFVAESQPVGYHVMKAGLHQLVRYYAARLGPQGIRVNCVSPCTVLKAENRDWYAQHEEVAKLFQDTIPLGRMVDARDVAQVIAFFCSPQAAAVTGQRLIVDGGVSLLSHEALARKLTGI